MGHAQIAQVFTDGDAGLACANNQGVDLCFFGCHIDVLLKACAPGQGAAMDTFCSAGANSENMIYVVAA
jgi:hypothetical protein